MPEARLGSRIPADADDAPDPSIHLVQSDCTDLEAAPSAKTSRKPCYRMMTWHQYDQRKCRDGLSIDDAGHDAA
jgi:hypothetical protein